MTETLIKILLFGTFSCVLLSLAIEDHRKNRLPNRLTIPLVLTGLLLNWTDTINQFGFHYISFQDSVLGAATRLRWEFGYCMKSSSTDQVVLASGWETQNILAALGAWFGWQSLPVLLVGSSLIMLTVYLRRWEKPFGVGLSITALGILGIHTFGSP